MQAIRVCCLLLLACFNTDARAPKDVHNFGIFGGKPVNISEVPFMVMLKAVLPSGPLGFVCGASIISNQFLISASHCVYGFNASTFKIVVGSDKIDDGEIYEIEKLIPNRNFSWSTGGDYDLSVIKLKKKLVFGDHVKPIELADTTLPQPGEMLEIIGFGETEHSNVSKVLLKVNVPYVDKKTCIKLNAHSVTDRFICAGGQGVKGACYGDSGSALIYKGKLIGAVSRTYNPSHKCATKGYPDIFA